MSALESKAKTGFIYVVEHVRGTVFDENDPRIVLVEGAVIDRETIHNLIPDEGVKHMQEVIFKAATQVNPWYLSIFEGNYTPIAGLTAAAYPAAATECTAYTAGTRLEWIEGAVVGGSLDNSASKAEFTMNADKTIYGAVLSSAAAKGAVTGVLGSAVRFATAKAVLSGDILRLTATSVLASA